MTLVHKAARLVGGGYSADQVMRRIKRSPLKHFVKLARGLGRRDAKRERREIARSLVTPAARERARTLDLTGGLDLGQLDPALTAELIAEVRRLSDNGAGQVRGHKDFWRALLDRDALHSDSIFVRFAAQRQVLEILSAAFGEFPYLSQILVTHSFHSAEPHKVSQLWHLDYDDVRVVKLFAYLTDVETHDDGPFSYLPPGPSKQVGFGDAAHLPDERVFRKVRRSELKEVMGPRGHAFLVDTSRCIHMGSRVAPGHRRLLYTAAFGTVPTIYDNQNAGVRIAGPLDRQMQLLLQEE